MLLILIGKSASGKTYMQSSLVKKENYRRIITDTTRPMRQDEKNGVEYNFRSYAEFFKLKSLGTYVETRHYTTKVNNKLDIWYYGSPKVNVELGKNVMILDVDGALSFLEHYGPQNIEVLYLDVPDSIRRERAEKRASFDLTEWERRLKDDEIKFSEERLSLIKEYFNKDYKSHFKVINNY